MLLRLTVAVLMLDIETEWTLNALLTTSSSYRKCSKRRTLDHSAQAISLQLIEGTTKCSRIARGFSFGSGMEFVAVREHVSANFGSSGSLCQQLLNRNPFQQTSLVVRYPD